jgi:hypothetical protein
MLKNPRHEAFAQEMAKGNSKAAEAYRIVTGKNGTAARNIAHKWMAKGDVQRRITELRQKATEKTGFDLQQMLEYCIELVKLKPGDFDKNSRFAQVTIKETPDGTVKEYKMMDKAKALDVLAEIGGYYRPQVKDTAQGSSFAPVIINMPPILMQPRRVAGRTIDALEEQK